MSTKSVLSAKSTKIVDKVIAFLSIKENTRFYNQRAFVRRHSENVCETECCLAGWMVYANSKAEYNKLAVKRDEVGIRDAAERLMTLANGSSAVLDNLFIGSGGYWPGELGTQWDAIYFSDTDNEEPSTRFKLAQIAIKRLELFKKTGE